MSRILRSLLLVVAFPLTAYGWGCEGHQIIALIARAHLSAAASAAVDQLLAASPVDPSLKRFCADRMKDRTGLADPFAADSTWADDVREKAKNGPWHYIDIPRAEAEGSIDPYCPPLGPPSATGELPGCVVNAIQAQRTALQNRDASVASRATALRYLVHFVGDLHQPLHTTDNNDHGGNCTVLRYFDLDHPTNLHAVWDYNILEHDLFTRRVTVSADAQRIDRQYAAHGSDWGSGQADLSAWVWDGHTLANTIVYANTAPPIPIEKPVAANVCEAETHKVEKLAIQIGEAYQGAAAPVIEGQLARAGYRLAAMLNRIWP